MDFFLNLSFAALGNEAKDKGNTEKFKHIMCTILLGEMPELQVFRLSAADRRLRENAKIREITEHNCIFPFLIYQGLTVTPQYLKDLKESREEHIRSVVSVPRHVSQKHIIRTLSY